MLLLGETLFDGSPQPFGNNNKCGYSLVHQLLHCQIHFVLLAHTLTQLQTMKIIGVEGITVFT